MKKGEPQLMVSAIMDCVDEAMFCLDSSYNYTSFNKAHAAMMKALYGADIEIGKSLYLYQTNPEDAAKSKTNIDRALSGERFTDGAFFGEESHARIPVLVTHNPIRDRTGRVIGIAVYARDLTSRHKELRDFNGVQTRYRRIFDYTTDGVIVFNAETGEVVDVNPAFIRLFGCSRIAVLGKKLWEVETLKDLAPSGEECFKLKNMEPGRRYELLIKAEDRRNIYVQVIVNPFRANGIELVQMNIADITRRKLDEEKIRDNESHLRAAQSIAHIGSWEWDAATKSAKWSDEMYNLFGFTPQDFHGDPSIILDRIHPDDLLKYNELLDGTLRKGKIFAHPIEYRVVLPGGKIRHMITQIVHSTTGENAAKIMGTVQDITSWKLTQEALSLQSNALQSAASAIVITDISGSITFVNAAFTLLTGFSAEEAIGKNLRILKSGVHGEAIYKDLWETVVAGKIWHGLLVNKRKDGSLYNEEQTITPVRVHGDGITHFIAIKQDITERIKSDEALKSSMEEMRELAERIEKVREEERKLISHEVHDELGQILTAVKMNLLSLEDIESLPKVDFKKKIRATSFLIDESMKTVRDISARLRPGVLDYLGLIPAIEWQVERFQHHSGIKCKMQLPPQETKVDDERSTILFRILQETLTNVGRHAHASRVWINLSETGADYVLYVADDGVGIQQEQIDNPHSFGLIGIRERLRPLGGTSSIRHRENGGTEIVVKLPKEKK